VATEIGNQYGAFASEKVSPDAFYNDPMHHRMGWAHGPARTGEHFARANGELAGNNGPSVLDQWRSQMLGQIMGYQGPSDASMQNVQSPLYGKHTQGHTPGPPGVAVDQPGYGELARGAFESPDVRPQRFQENIGAQGPDSLWPRSYDRRG
jgi:hypothetical protein